MPPRYPCALASSLALAGCLLGDAPRPPEVVVVSSAPAITAAKAPARAPSRLQKLFTRETAPSPFRAASKLAFGMHVDDARRAAPELFGRAPVAAEGFEGVSLSVETRAGAVNALVA